MNVNLFTTFYQDKNQQRFEELKHCLRENSKVNFGTIHIVTEDVTVKPIIDELTAPRICRIDFVEKRPTFNNFFEVMSMGEYKNDLNIICNSDIFFTDLDPILNIYGLTEHIKNTCLALSRWDCLVDGRAVHWDAPDSQDTWVFFGRPRLRTTIEFGMGISGCDNRLAWEFVNAGYNVINPSKSVKTYHYHLSNVRNYIENGAVKETIPPPYFLVKPE